MQYSQLQRAMAAGVRIFEVLDLEPDITDRPDAATLPEIQGEIRYQDVDFHYVEGVPVLRNVNLHIRAGENVALVGSTGAGKSTLVNLLHRFADVTGGSIAIDGHDLRAVKRESLVHQMSMVLQEPYLFSGTVRENICYQRQDATDEQIIAAAQAVGAHDFIMELENGLRLRTGGTGRQLKHRPAAAHQLRPRHRGQPPHPGAGRGHRQH